MMIVPLILALLAPQDSLQDRLEKKLKSPFLQKAGWVTDYDQALAKAKESKKPIFGYFTRSYSP